MFFMWHVGVSTYIKWYDVLIIYGKYIVYIVVILLLVLSYIFFIYLFARYTRLPDVCLIKRKFFFNPAM